MPWREITTPLYPWVVTIDRILQVEKPPTISGPTMYIASDYSGANKSSRYHVSVILCADLKASVDWLVLSQKVRQEYLADGRRMSYKSLSDRQRAKALIPFLSAAEYIHGLCFVVIVNKNIRNLCLNSDDYDKMRKILQLQGRWKDKELEEALRLTHFVGCLIGGLSQSKQNIYWISDEDSLFANTSRSQDMARLLSSYSSHYAKWSLGEIGIGTTAIDEGDRIDEDFAAVTDLVAGGVAEVTTRLSEVCGGRIPSKLAIEYDREFLPKADLIARWLWLGRSNLRRVAVLFEKQQGKELSVSRYQMLSE
ncbi:hypothetical protein H6G04_34850 [Calothrix membranacea FACHB-236]|nr:hypothetical protein [Calothrix membranacea FACHB-236]